jgi:hypothetical protein
VIFAIGEGLFRGNRNIAPVAFSALLLQLALVALMPNRLHRGMSALFACIAWALALRFGLWDHSWQPVAARPGDPASSPLRAVVGWALVWLPVAGALVLLVRTEAAWMARRWQAILRPAAGGLIVGLAIGTLLSYPMESLRWWTDRMDAHEQWLALWPLLSALAALGALAAAFALGSRGLMGVCVAAALLHISHFYYAMGTSLLVKSITLLILGGLMLWGARHVRRMGANP